MHRIFNFRIFLLVIALVSPAISVQIFPYTDHSRRLFFNFFTIVALSIMGLYNCVIYIMRTKDHAPLYFGIFCLLISVNNFVSDGSIVFLRQTLFSGRELLLQKTDFLTVMMSIPCFMMFLHAFFPGLGNRIMHRCIQIITAGFITAVILFSGYALELTFKCFFPVIVAMIVYSMVIGIKAANRQLKDARGILSGILILSAAGANDVLWGMNVLHTVILLPYAAFVFTFIYSVLISRRFSNALTGAERLAVELIENQRLREEMQTRIAHEQDMRQTQRRLTGLLHSIELPLCAIDDTGIICFCNRAFEELAGQPLSVLAGKEPAQCINIKEKEMSTVPLELEDEQLSVLLFGSSGSDQSINRSAILFVEELNRNRERIRSLEKLLTNTNPDALKVHPQLNHDLDLIDTALEQMGHMLSSDEDLETKKRLGLELITLAIGYWTECTQKTKFELAEESGLWKVQINPDGWKRTQTLDRYLDLKTFPQNPRWSRLLKTADFVLIRCSESSQLRNRLELCLEKLSIIESNSK